jgi:hypothetical protein
MSDRELHQKAQVRMKERPILFSGPLVRAILEGRKTQTRRLVKGPWTIDEHPDTGKLWPLYPGYVNGGDDEGMPASCPFGERGDRLWVRETWAAMPAVGATCVVYRASCDGDEFDYVGDDGSVYRAAVHRWRPSIHMPRWASRITLEVTGVRVERLQDISERDAVAEGIAVYDFGWYTPGDVYRHNAPTHAFRSLWDRINGARASWASNPFVWVVEFRRVKE